MQTTHIVRGAYVLDGYTNPYNSRVLVLAIIDGTAWATDDCERPEVELRLDRDGNLRGWAEHGLCFSPDDDGELVRIGLLPKPAPADAGASG